jgi:hypothetical protein
MPGEILIGDTIYIPRANNIFDDEGTLILNFKVNGVPDFGLITGAFPLISFGSKNILTIYLYFLLSKLLISVKDKADWTGHVVSSYINLDEWIQVVITWSASEGEIKISADGGQFIGSTNYDGNLSVDDPDDGNVYFHAQGGVRWLLGRARFYPHNLFPSSGGE